MDDCSTRRSFQLPNIWRTLAILILHCRIKHIATNDLIMKWNCLPLLNDLYICLIWYLLGLLIAIVYYFKQSSKQTFGNVENNNLKQSIIHCDIRIKWHIQNQLTFSWEFNERIPSEYFSIFRLSLSLF